MNTATPTLVPRLVGSSATNVMCGYFHCSVMCSSPAPKAVMTPQSESWFQRRKRATNEERQRQLIRKEGLSVVRGGSVLQESAEQEFGDTSATDSNLTPAPGSGSAESDELNGMRASDDDDAYGEDDDHVIVAGTRVNIRHEYGLVN